MKKLLTVFVIIYFVRLNVFACIISEDTIINQDVKEGIKVIKDCTIKFSNEQDIKIGSSGNNCSGIEVGIGVKLRIDVSSNYNVDVYGGYYVQDDNEYNCASIYVPPTSSLIIESLGKGSLVVYPFDRSSGIGGNGALIEKHEIVEQNRDAGEIIIKKGTVEVRNVIESSNYGMGAKIGGGGICNISNDTKVLHGGNLEKFEIIDGKLIIMGNFKETTYGVGAMIGGGGIVNLDDKVEYIYGGNLMEISVQGGEIDIFDTDSKEKYGVGAKIGGGGIYNLGDKCNIKKGQVFLVDVCKGIHIENMYGDSGVYNNRENIESGIQIKNIEVRYKTLKNYVVDKILDMVFIGAGMFMIFELVT